MKLRSLLLGILPVAIAGFVARPAIERHLEHERRERAEAEARAQREAEHPEPTPPREGDDDDEEARPNFSLAHSYPAGRLPHAAYRRARESWRAMPRAQQQGAGKHAHGADPKSITWKPLGPAPLDLSKGVESTPHMGPTAGRASSIAIDPTNTSVLYAGFSLGGVWKSTDKGATWAPIFDDQPTVAIGALAIDPADHETIYAGTGEPALYAGYFGAGLFKSTDAGAGWARVDGDQFDGVAISRLVFDGKDLYATTVFGEAGRGEACGAASSDAPNQGLFKSSDGGATWKKLRDGTLVDFEIDATKTPRHLFVSELDQGVFRSIDGGATWTQPDGFPAADFLNRVELSIAPSDPDVIWAGMGVSGATAVLVSNDGGATFAQVPNPPNYCPNQCYWDNTVVVNPTDPGRVYTGGSICGVWGTSDGLDPTPTFSNLSAFKNGDCGTNQGNWYLGNVHPDVHFGAFNPSDPATVYFATDGGVVVTHDQGATWQRLTEGVATIQLYGLCLDPTDVDVMYGGAQDNGSFKRTGDTMKWAGFISGDGGPCAVDSGDPKTVLMSNDEGFLYVAHDSFDKFIPTTSFNAAEGCKMGKDPGCGDRTAFIVPVAGDPSTPGVFYVGTYRLWKNDQGGLASAWKAVSDDLTALNLSCESGGSGDDVLTAIVVAPSDPKTIYTGSAGGALQQTKDGGATWTEIDKLPTPERWVSSIAVDPHDATKVYAAFSGFGANTAMTPAHVFSSSDGGDTWKAIDIPVDIPVDAIVTHPVVSGLLYVGTDVGVLVSIDDGASWQVLGDSLPNTAVYGLAFHAKGQRLVAATYGRSVWATDFTTGTLSADPAMLSFTMQVGADDPKTQTVSALDSEQFGSSIAFSVAADSPWIVATTTSGFAGGGGAAIPIGVHGGDMKVGEYDGNVTLTPTTPAGAAVTVAVHLSITAEPTPPPPPAAPADDSSGCGCELERPVSSNALGLLALAAVLSIARSRRRRS